MSNEDLRHDQTRVHNQPVEIDERSVSDFFTQRAGRFDPSKPLVSIMYQDQRPELARERDRYEKAKILPRLNLDGSETVLDVGCGIGRWASAISEGVRDYIGIDADPELIRIARSISPNRNCRFNAIGAADVGDAPFILAGTVNLVIVCGLFPYLNDATANRFLAGLYPKLAPGARLYLREPLGQNGRFTLRNHWSEEMGQYYSAIYRSREEMLELLASQLKGFHTDGFEPLYEQADLNNRAETRQYFLLGGLNND